MSKYDEQVNLKDMLDHSCEAVELIGNSISQKDFKRLVLMVRREDHSL